MRLAESVLAMTVTGEAPDSEEYDAIISPSDYDMELLADPTTVCLVPWVPAPNRTAQIIHDCYFADGRLVDFAPRSVLRRVRELYQQDGLEPVVAPELEFYLIAQNTDPDFPLAPPVVRSDGAGARHPDPRDRRRPDGGQFPARRSAGPGRPRVLLQKNAARSGAAAQDVRDVHGQADGQRAGQRNAHPPEHRRAPHRAQHLFQHRRLAVGRVSPLHRRAAEVPAGGDGVPGTVRELVPQTGPARRCADQHPLGARQSHGRHPGAALVARVAPRRKPRDRRRCESLRGHGGDAGVRLPGHEGAGRAERGVNRQCVRCRV